MRSSRKGSWALKLSPRAGTTRSHSGALTALPAPHILQPPLTRGFGYLRPTIIQKYDWRIRETRYVSFKLCAASRTTTKPPAAPHSLLTPPACQSRSSGLSYQTRCLNSSVLMFKSPCLFFVTAPKSKSSDAGNLDTPKRAHKVLPLGEKVKVLERTRTMTIC